MKTIVIKPEHVVISNMTMLYRFTCRQWNRWLRDRIAGKVDDLTAKGYRAVDIGYVSFDVTDYAEPLAYQMALDSLTYTGNPIIIANFGQLYQMGWTMCSMWLRQCAVTDNPPDVPGLLIGHIHANVTDCNSADDFARIQNDHPTGDCT